mmetsp:Transcript_3500/g.6704  ORF Transcript_3500/g.6704 Transcript_3500/m.6704 type:complete len:238 (+) Transcript_3500:47-760(+)
MNNNSPVHENSAAQQRLAVTDSGGSLSGRALFDMSTYIRIGVSNAYNENAVSSTREHQVLVQLKRLTHFFCSESPSWTLEEPSERIIINLRRATVGRNSATTATIQQSFHAVAAGLNSDSVRVEPTEFPATLRLLDAVVHRGFRGSHNGFCLVGSAVVAPPPQEIETATGVVLRRVLLQLGLLLACCSAIGLVEESKCTRPCVHVISVFRHAHSDYVLRFVGAAVVIVKETKAAYTR